MEEAWPTALTTAAASTSVPNGVLIGMPPYLPKRKVTPPVISPLLYQLVE